MPKSFFSMLLLSCMVFVGLEAKAICEQFVFADTVINVNYRYLGNLKYSQSTSGEILATFKANTPVILLNQPTKTLSASIGLKEVAADSQGILNLGRLESLKSHDILRLSLAPGTAVLRLTTRFDMKTCYFANSDFHTNWGFKWP